jgi:hypothetical protein
VYLKGRSLTAEGSVSATWIATTFHVDRRNVKRAKAKLRELKWLAEKPSGHWHRQRYGKTVAVNLSWSEGARHTVGNGASLPPPSLQISTGLPPPDSDRELPENMNNQKRMCAAGVHEEAGRKGKPKLARVIPADLIEPSRTAELFRQAIRRGMVKDAAMDRLQFFAAAQRAMRLGRNPGGFFTTILRRRLWPHLSGCDEELARRTLAEVPEFFHGCKAAPESRALAAKARSSHGCDDSMDPLTIRKLVRRSLATAPFAVRDGSP